MQTLKFLFVASVLALHIPAAAFADGACNSDASFLCSGKSSAELEKCLDEKGPQVSQDCRNERQAKKDKAVSEALAACGDQVNEFCTQRERHETIMDCLRRNEPKLTAGCREKLPAAVSAPSYSDRPPVDWKQPARR